MSTFEYLGGLVMGYWLDVRILVGLWKQYPEHPNLCQISFWIHDIIYPQMFESASFLALYLPKHFNAFFSKTEQTFEQFDPRFLLSFTEFVSMCQTLHYSSTSRLYLYTFLIKCLLKSSHQNLLVSHSMLDIENLADIIHSNFGDVNNQLFRPTTWALRF